MYPSRRTKCAGISPDASSRSKGLYHCVFILLNYTFKAYYTRSLVIQSGLKAFMQYRKYNNTAVTKEFAFTLVSCYHNATTKAYTLFH